MVTNTRVLIFSFAVLLGSGQAEAAPPSCLAASVASGPAAMCALREDGVASCWDDAESYTQIRQRALGQFTQISVGYDRSCGLRRDGTVACWYRYDFIHSESQAPAPEGRFSMLAVEPMCGHYAESLCLGLREDGTLVQWVADDPADVSSPIAGTFVDWQGPCGLRSDGTVECIDGWTAPDGHFTSLGKGELLSRCGIRDDGAIACWTRDESIESPFPAGEYADVALAYRDIGCALDVNGAVTCRDGEADVPFPAGTYRDITTPGPRRICAVREGGDLVCIGGSNTQGTYGVPYQAPVIGSFTHVAVGGDANHRAFNCGLDAAGEISCWGNLGQYAPSPPSAGPFDQIAMGAYHMCGRRPDHTVECWSHYLGEDYSPEGTFRQISASFLNFTCGIHDDGTVACWRANNGGEVLDSPEGQFTEVAAAGLFSCGLRPNGDAECWSHPLPYVEPVNPVVPPGPFVHIAGGASQAGGDTYVCGIRPDGSIECWGDDFLALLSPFRGDYQSIAAGGEFACGLRSDGNVDCWGADVFMHTPRGPFVEIAAGYQNACGLKTNGSFECWGNDATASFCGSDAACGDGETAFPEQCDDGDVNDVGQPCTNDCEIVRCGQPVSIRTQKPHISDALFVLLAANAARNCAAAVCDVDHSSAVTATDALLVLRAAVGLGADLTCL